MPQNKQVFDEKPKVEAVYDEKPKLKKMEGEMTRSYQVAHTAGVIMLSVPLILYSSAGTETQWSELGGIF